MPACEAERRPVELVVRDEPGMLLAAGAVERDAVDGRVRRRPARRSSRRNDESGTDVSPRAGHANVYRVVSTSYIRLY